MRAVRAMIAADPDARRARSDRIWARIVASTDLGALGPGSGTGRAQMRVLLYESLPTEPETEAWYAWCRDHDVAVFSPAVDGVELRVEPGDVDPTTLDVVVVPGLAFTTDGRRLGQGGGHYDRFLRRLPTTCVTVGTAFAEQLVDDLPTEDHDVHVHLVVTDA